MPRFPAAALLACCLVPSGHAATVADTLVTTGSGTVRGVVAGAVVSFKGIPYAAPPLGPLRWRPPQPPKPWRGVRDASEFGHDCMQVPTEFEVLATTPNEDCLYLNVWRPAGEGRGLPVLVWIHGGGFVGGGSSSPFYDGSAFARQGLVVVSFNYRLGRLGFFAHPALLAATEEPVANYGYMDQLAALRWVQDNIAAFGGDPRRVTIMGESAGGASVLALVTSPLAAGRFQQVVVLSGGGRQPILTRPMTNGSPMAPSADATDLRFAESLGVAGTGADALARLRALPAQDIIGNIHLGVLAEEALRCVAGEAKQPGTQAGCIPVYSGTPVIDGRIVTGTPEARLQAGDAQRVPVLIGTTATDLPQFFPPIGADPFSYFGDDADAARAHYTLPWTARLVLFVTGKREVSRLAPWLSIGADMTMHEPARFVARQVTAGGNRAWVYRFTYTAESTRPKAKKQTHSGELPFLFQTLEARYADSVTANDRAMARAFGMYVGSFARTGDPNGGDLPTWPAFDPARYEVMDFSLERGPAFGPDPRAGGIALVERAAAQLDR